MFINPKIAIQQQWIKFPDYFTDEQKQKSLQPNAIDFSVDEIRLINPLNTFIIGENEKIMREQELIEPHLDYYNQPYWMLGVGAYDIMSNFYVNVPPGMIVLLYPRSTFVRNGLFITNGIFDQGFSGSIGCVLHNPLGSCIINKGTRIGQVAFISAEDSGVLYAGGYNTAVGQHWTANKKDK